MRNPLRTFVAIAAFAGIVSSVHAVDRHFISNAGSWTSASNWSPTGVPQPADNAILDFFNGAGGRASINADVGGVTSVKISNAGTMVFSNGGTLIVGSGGLTVGSNNTAGLMTMFNLNPLIDYHASLLMTGPLYVGRLSGAGTIRQNSGTIALGSALEIGSAPDTTSMFGSSGTYNFGGGAFRGTTVSVGGYARSNGTLNVSAGSFGADSMVVSGFSDGNGTVNHAGGTVELSSFLEIGSAVGSGRGIYTLSGGTLDVPAIQLGDGPGSGEFNYNGGTIVVNTIWFHQNSRMTLAAGGSRLLRLDAFLHMGDFPFVEKGVLDLNDNRMTLAGFQENYDEVRADLRTGYNGGAWNGQGIISTTAATSPTHSRALGYLSGVSDGIVVQYTYFGDTDLNGVVNFDDYSRIDNGFNTGGTDWLHGDFNYDGVVNFDDYSLIDLAFNTQSNTLARALSYLDGQDRTGAGMNSPPLRIVQEHFAQFGQSYARSFLDAVPEPGTATTLFGAIMLLCSATRPRPVALIGVAERFPSDGRQDR